MANTVPGDFKSLSTQISAEYDQLSKRLKQLATFALDNPTDMALETVAVIADRAEVQPSTLIRFANNFGYSGFSEMQKVFRTKLLEHSASYRDRLRLTQFSELESPKPDALLQQFVQGNIGALERLAETTEKRHLNRAIKLMAKAESLYILGQGRSFPVASYFVYALRKMDRMAHMVDGLGGMLLDQSSMVRKQDAALVISFRPYAKDTIQAVKSIAKTGAPIIALTDSSLSPVASVAKVCFEIREAEVRSFRSLSATLSLAQALVLGLQDL